jgi:hypothetical protein
VGLVLSLLSRARGSRFTRGVGVRPSLGRGGILMIKLFGE